MSSTQTTPGKSRKKVVWVLLAGFIFVLLCVAIDLAYLWLRVEFGSDEWSLAEWFSRRSPANTQSPATEPQPTRTINVDAPVVLPGLEPQALEDLYTSRGFECTPVDIGLSGFYQGKCTKETENAVMELYFFGRTEETIDLLDANFIQKDNPSDQKAAEYFKSVAALPEKNAAQHPAVQQWLEETLPLIKENRDIHVEEFGGVRYRLYGAPLTRSLEIGYLP